MEAVKQNGLALKYIGHRLVDIELDKICLAAVRQNELALEFVDIKLYKS